MPTIRSEFAVHRLNPPGFLKAEQLAAAFSKLLNEIDELVPDGREKSLVITKLQEACFFAKRGIAVNTANQEPPPAP